MLVYPKRRTFLNRADPRVRGRVTWFPLDGHGRNMGDVGGGFVLPAGQTFSSSGDPGPLVAGDASSVAPTLTASSMGLLGNASRTIFIKYRSDDNYNYYPFFSMGTGSSGQDFTFLRDNQYGTCKLNFWDGNLDYNFQPWPVGYGDAMVTLVITITAAGLIQWWAMAQRLTVGASGHGNNGDLTFTSGSKQLPSVLSTPNGYPLNFGYWPAANTAGNSRPANAQLCWFGILGGAVWTAQEAQAFLLNPDELWTPRPLLRRKIARRRRPLITVGLAA